MTNEIIAGSAVVGVLVSAGAILFSLKALRDQLWLQTFAEYTGRYNAIAREFPSESRRPGGNFDLERLAADDKERITAAVRAYLNLCSEEHFLWRRRRIDDVTWGIWTHGMRETFRLPWFRASWPSFREEYMGYPEFVDFVEACLSTVPEDIHESEAQAPRARDYLSRLIGQTIYTLSGKANRVLRIEGDKVVVATERSPGGKPVPVAEVQAALDELYSKGELAIEVETVGYRSAFIGAVCWQLCRGRLKFRGRGGFALTHERERLFARGA